MRVALRLQDPTDITRPAETVLIGDGQSLDQTGDIISQAESGQFSMDVNNTIAASDTSPNGSNAGQLCAHSGGANICFVDGHVDRIVLPFILRAMSNGAPMCKQWQSEFLNSAGLPTDLPAHEKTLQNQPIPGMKRNPQMPLTWSQPGKLYAPP